MVELVERLDELTGRHAEWLEGDRRFHLACYAGVTTPRLLRMITGFWDTTQRYRRILLTTFTDVDFDLIRAEHRLMADALLAHNARAGEDLLRLAMERSRMRLARHRRLFDQ